MAQSLKGKVAFVTGAGRGIGRATAIALAHEGVNVGLFARTESALKEVATEIEGLGVKVAYTTVRCFIIRSSGNKGIEKLTNTLGTADILINNAGIGKFGTLLEVRIQKSGKRMIDVNVMGTYYVPRKPFFHN